MAVHKRGYRAYTGARTPAWSRFLVVARYAALEVFQSRVALAVFVISFIPPLGWASYVYLTSTPAALALIGLESTTFPPVDPAFFLRAVRTQGFLAFILAAWIGPGLIAPDLANGALPLYLSRPLSRAEYVLGKLTVLLGLLSSMTWVPLLVVYALKAGLAQGWLAENLRTGGAIFASCFLWIAVIGLLSVALSATVRRRLNASLLMCGLFFIGAPFGQVWWNVMGNHWGQLANLTYLILLIWRDLFGVLPDLVRRHGELVPHLPIASAWCALLAVCVVSLALLDRRLRAREIVR
jgi:ABC-2 type transport system permease protein